jgi:hypothetical protein
MKTEIAKKYETAFIYGLIDPLTGAIRYVGESVNVEKRRMWHWHQRRYDSGNMPLKLWLRSLEEPPEAMVFAEVPFKDRFEVERLLTIGIKRVMGDLLLNMNAGQQPGAETRARMSAAKTPEIRARIAERVREIWAERKRQAALETAMADGFIDATPALEARAMGVEMMNMAVLHESVGGSRQDAPVHEVTRHDVYVKVMAALRINVPEYVANHGGMGSAAAFKEHTRDMVTSLPDDIILHLADLWDDGQKLACAEEYMSCLRTLLVLRGMVINAQWEINREEAA